MTAVVSQLLAVKLPAEMEYSRAAGLLSALSMQRVMRKEIIDTVEDSLKRKHSEMADRVEKSMLSGKLAVKAQLAPEVRHPRPT